MATAVPQFKIVIPARYASQRLPGKPLIRIAGKSMLEHVYDCARMTNAEQVVIATDDQRIADEASRFSTEVCMTSSEHPTGTDRIAEVVDRYAWVDDDIVVNLQGDEPLMPAQLVEQVADNLFKNPSASISTLCAPIDNLADAGDPSKVKVVFDRNNNALYFSRSSIPFSRENHGENPLGLFRHIGLYAYRVHFLKAFQLMPECELEQLERLEQLRALWNGYKIHVDLAVQLPGQDVNTELDLKIVESIMARGKDG